MSVITIASGSDFMCFQRGGTSPSYTYTPISGQTNCSLKIDPKDRDISSKNQGRWGNKAAGLIDWSASVDIDMIDPATANTSEINWDNLVSDIIDRTQRTYVFAWATALTSSASVPAIDQTRPMYSGLATVNFPIGGKHGENMSTSIELQGCLELTVVNPT